jgi:GNAT superfamily N-acetyltransferase
VTMNIQPIVNLSFDDLKPLLDLSLQEAYGFLQTLWDEYQSGKTTFSEHGAVLLGSRLGERLIAVGGIHTDPYLNSPSVGRIRHVYVDPIYRRNGVGKQLVHSLVRHASSQFRFVTLRTQTQQGCAFYEALGFSPVFRFEHATHWIEIGS